MISMSRNPIPSAVVVNVQGEEGEIYDKADYLNANLKNVSAKKSNRAKPWWKFWK
jgi:hypothetical protein